MNTVIFVGGANGSGKSTLARELMSNLEQEFVEWSLPNGSIITACKDFAFLGSYKNACGGLDTFKNWEQIEEAIKTAINAGIHKVFCEGVTQFGVQRYLGIQDIPNTHLVYINLATDIRQSIQNVLHRRALKGNTKELDPKNIYDKEKGCFSLYINLIKEGLKDCYRLTYEQALDCCKYYLTLEE